MKSLIVREAFSLGANFYPRGAEITDAEVIPMAKDQFPSHVVDSQDDVPAPAPAKKAAK